MIYLFLFALALVAIVTGSSFAGRREQRTADAEMAYLLEWTEDE